MLLSAVRLSQYYHMHFSNLLCGEDNFEAIIFLITPHLSQSLRDSCAFKELGTKLYRLCLNNLLFYQQKTQLISSNNSKIDIPLK